jgi:hypothetical protein
MTVEQVLNYIKTTSQLHAQLEMHVSEHGGDTNNSEWELREDTQPETDGDNDSIAIEPAEVAPQLKSPPEDHLLVAECVAVAVQDHYKSVGTEEEEQIEIAKALSIMDQIPEDKTPEGKIPALPEEDFKMQQQYAKDQEYLKRQLRNQEDEKIRKDIEEMGIVIDPIPPPLKSNENEEFPGTPKQKHEPTIVTPKDPSNAYVEEIIFNDDMEVSNLTAPSAVLAGPTPKLLMKLMYQL